MMRQSEFKRKYDPDRDKYTKQHIYGEGIMDSVKSFGSKLRRKTTNKKVSFNPPPPPPPKTGKKAGDKIVKMLSREKLPTTPKKMTQKEITNRVLQIMTGEKNYIIIKSGCL